MLSCYHSSSFTSWNQKPVPLILRTITKKHRLIYEIFETEVYVDVLSAYGHYDDK